MRCHHNMIYAIHIGKVYGNLVRMTEFTSSNMTLMTDMIKHMIRHMIWYTAGGGYILGLRLMKVCLARASMRPSVHVFVALALMHFACHQSAVSKQKAHCMLIPGLSRECLSWTRRILHPSLSHVSDNATIL